MINVFSIVGDELCVSSEDGDKLFTQINTFLSENKKVNISFKNVSLITSAFLNSAIGKLYGIYTGDQLKDLISVSEMKESDKGLLQRVIDNAKSYYSNPDKYKTTILEE